MSLPSRRAILVYLTLPGTLAAAQSAPTSRQRVNRSVVLSVDAPEPVDTLRLAPGTLTTLLFDAPLDKASVELEGKDLRIRLVDVGERSLLLEAAMELSPSERWLLRVRFLDGALPEHAVFALVSHPTQVDGDVRVSRHTLTPEACQAELSQLRSRCTQAPSPADFILAGWVADEGVRGWKIKGSGAVKSPSGLVVRDGWIYSSLAWVVISVQVQNQGRQPWAPAQAKLVSVEGGTSVRVRAVRIKRASIASGEIALVAVEADLPPKELGPTFSLELADADGQRTLIIPRVKLREGERGPRR